MTAERVSGLPTEMPQKAASDTESSHAGPGFASHLSTPTGSGPSIAAGGAAPGIVPSQVAAQIESALAEFPVFKGGEVVVRLAGAPSVGGALPSAEGEGPIAHEVRVARDADGLIDVTIRVATSEGREQLAQHGATLAGRLHGLGLSLRTLTIQVSAPLPARESGKELGRASQQDAPRRRDVRSSRADGAVVTSHVPTVESSRRDTE